MLLIVRSKMKQRRCEKYLWRNRWRDFIYYYSCNNIHIYIYVDIMPSVVIVTQRNYCGHRDIYAFLYCTSKENSVFANRSSWLSCRCDMHNRCLTGSKWLVKRCNRNIIRCYGTTESCIASRGKEYYSIKFKIETKRMLPHLINLNNFKKNHTNEVF